MKKLFVLLLLLSGFMYSYTETYGAEWEKNMYMDELHPISNPEVWVNGQASEYSASTIDIGSLADGEDFSIEIKANSLLSEFPVDNIGQPTIYYRLYYGYASANLLTVTDTDGESSTRYWDPGDAADTRKYWKSGQVKEDSTPILHVKNSSGGSNYVWLSFVWIIRIENNQKAVKNTTAEIAVTISP